MISRTKRTSTFSMLVLLALEMIISGCVANICSDRSAVLLSMPVEDDISTSRVGSIHRLQGVYRSGFELGSLLATRCPPQYKSLCDIRGLGNPTDYCVYFDRDQCFCDLERGTKAIGESAATFTNFGFVDLVVRYDGTPPSLVPCVLGSITVLHVIQANPISAGPAQRF
jgi:hypothetical protein